MTKVPRFGEIAETLEANGYQPIPTRWRKKIPVLDDWSNYKELTPDYLAKHKSKGTSLLSAQTNGIDIDVLDLQIADLIEATVSEILGARAPVRYGLRPKRLLLCRADEIFTKKTTPEFKEPNGTKHKVEILADGQQFVAFNLHPDTREPYTWEGGDPLAVAIDDLPALTEDMADQIIAMASKVLTQEIVDKRRGAAGGTGANGTLPTDGTHECSDLGGDAPTLNDLVDTVWKISPEIARDDWIKVGHAIKAAGEVWPDDAEQLWVDWCASSEEYGEANADGAAQAAWDGFRPTRAGYGSLVYYSEEFPLVDLDVETVEIDAGITAEPTAPPTDAQETGADLDIILNPPGLVGELAEFTGMTARRDTPRLNVLAGLACVSAISSNGFVVRLPGGLTPLNLYLLGVAPTGAGKENIRSTCMRALHAAGMDDTFLDYVASDAGLHRVLGDEDTATPILWSCDEFGRYLKAAANAKTGGHQYAVLTYAMRLYGLALSSASARPRADKKESLPPVTCPYLSTLLTTTPHELHTALSSTEVVNGVLSRLVALHVPRAFLKPRNRAPAPVGFSESLARQIKGLKGAADDAWTRRESRPQVQCMGRWFTAIGPETAAARALEDFEYEADELSQAPGTISELWTRTFENAVRIAGVVAIGDQDKYEAPVLGPSHANYGIALARHATEEMIRMVQSNVADSDFERNCNKLFEKMRSVLATAPAASTETDLAANKLGVVTGNQIHLICRWLPAKERDACVKGLVDRSDLSVKNLAGSLETHQGKGYEVKRR